MKRCRIYGFRALKDCQIQLDSIHVYIQTILYNSILFNLQFSKNNMLNVVYLYFHVCLFIVYVILYTYNM